MVDRKSVPKLASGRSPMWAVMERFEVPDYDDPDTLYLTRWRLIQTPWFGVYLHRLGGPDPRETLHDHPWPFVSFILSGGYDELRRDPMTMEVHHHQVRRVNVLGLKDAHSIRRLFRTPTWTLLLVGRRCRTWGYLESHTIHGRPTWVWTEFNKHRHAQEFDRAMARRNAGGADQNGGESDGS